MKKPHDTTMSLHLCLAVPEAGSIVLETVHPFLSLGPFFG